MLKAGCYCGWEKSCCIMPTPFFFYLTFYRPLFKSAGYFKIVTWSNTILISTDVYRHTVCWQNNHTSQLSSSNHRCFILVSLKKLFSKYSNSVLIHLKNTAESKCISTPSSSSLNPLRLFLWTSDQFLTANPAAIPLRAFHTKEQFPLPRFTKYKLMSHIAYIWRFTYSLDCCSFPIITVSHLLPTSAARHPLGLLPAYLYQPKGLGNQPGTGKIMPSACQCLTPH